MKYAIYGIGNYLVDVILDNAHILRDVILFCDSNPKKQNITLLDIPVISPQELMKHKDDLDMVYIATQQYYKEISCMLIEEFNFPEEKISLLLRDEKKHKLKSMIFQYWMENYYNKIVEVKEEALKEAVLLPNRNAILKFMPQNAVCCEIGVAYGDFSIEILNEMIPEKFYAIDYFSQENLYEGFWGRDDFKRDNMSHQQWYENRFKNEIASGIVETRQGFSWDCLNEFPDNYFDYAYVDAGHDYDSVSKDIAVLEKKIKKGGLIQFNDYGPYFISANSTCGVYPAVNEFINKGRHKVKYFSLNPISLHDIVVEVCK